jgi:hypothetical protein
MVRDAEAFLYRPKKSAGANWMSGTLIFTTIANIANSTAQSTPKLIASDGSSLLGGLNEAVQTWPSV